jgi:exodeoxyribonuclease V gamma subunit
VEYSRLGAKHRLRAWVHLLALAAGLPGRDWCAATVGRGRDGLVMSALTSPTPDEARSSLRTLLAVRRAGLVAPLPLAPKTSCVYAEHLRRGSPPAGAVARAAQEWRKQLNDGREFGDYDDAWHQRVWGDSVLRDLLGEQARAGEQHADEPHRFGQLARQVFGPLLANETMH